MTYLPVFCLGCPGNRHVDGRDHYQERIDAGECAWCSDQSYVTVVFDDCPHATPACARCFVDYFDSAEAESLCPECHG